jgi:hypothetical protein
VILQDRKTSNVYVAVYYILDVRLLFERGKMSVLQQDNKSRKGKRKYQSENKNQSAVL